MIVMMMMMMAFLNLWVFSPQFVAFLLLSSQD